MEEHVYRYQAGPDNHVTARITQDELIHSSRAGRHKVPLAEIAEVHISSPRPMEHTCRVKTRSGRWHLLVSRSFLGFGKFTPHDEEYRAFLLALHRALAGRADIRFRGGIPFLYYFMLIASILLGAGLVSFGVLLVWALRAGKPVALGIGGLLANAALLVPFLRWTLARKPCAYNPTQVPEQWLP